MFTEKQLDVMKLAQLQINEVEAQFQQIKKNTEISFEVFCKYKDVDSELIELQTKSMKNLNDLLDYVNKANDCINNLMEIKNG